MRIRAKITLTFVAIFLLLVSVVITVAIYSADRSLTRQIENNIAISSQIETEKIATYINSQKEIANLMAASQVFRDFLKDSAQDVTYNYNKEQAQERLNRSITINKNYNEMFLLNKSGKVILSTDPKQIGVDHATDDYYTQGQKEAFIKSIYLSPITGKVSYALSSPIKDDATKELLGIFVIRVNIEDLYALISNQTGLGKTGENFLIDKNLYLITPSRYLDINNVLKTKIDTQNARECMANMNQNVVQNYIDYRNVPILGTHNYIPGANWCLITKIDRSEIYQPINSLRNIIVALASLGVLIITIIGLIITDKISKPIEKLTENVKQITQNEDWDMKLENNLKDEIGDLSKSFDQLVQKVKSSRLQIETKVKEQTQEITQKRNDLEEQQKAVLNILEDVDEEKQKSSLEKTKYEALLTSIGDGVIATDNETKVMVMNDAAEQILGYKKEDAFGKKLTDIFTVVNENGKPVPENERPINKAVSTMKPVFSSTTSNYYYQTQDGRKIPVSLNASPVVVNDGLIGVIDVFRDITHEKDIDRMKTEFISLSSHQLRTPLSAIKWFGEMLLTGDAGELSAEQKEFVNNIYESTERMIALVNSLLNISRIESGRIIIDPEPTALPDLVNDVIKEVQNKINEKKQNLIISIHTDLPKINIDPKLIREVYKNLLTNSIKYTPEAGEISVFISKNDKEIISQVSDTGYGIPEEEQKKVFAKFFRAENIVKLETEGTGLGLYLVKAIIESSGGKVWFESKVGKGTSFWFALPLTGSVAKSGDVAIDS